MKYIKTITIEADQFLRTAKELPEGVMHAGKGPGDIATGAFYVATNNGMDYLMDGDYIITEPSGSKYIVPKAEFEKEYRKVN